MPQDVYAIYNSLSVAQKQEVHDFMMFIAKKTYNPIDSKKPAAKRIGAAKGILKVPDDIDADNEEAIKAFEELKKMTPRLSEDFDYKEELANALTEKYESLI